MGRVVQRRGIKGIKIKGKNNWKALANIKGLKPDEINIVNKSTKYGKDLTVSVKGKTRFSLFVVTIEQSIKKMKIRGKATGKGKREVPPTPCPCQISEYGMKRNDDE